MPVRNARGYSLVEVMVAVSILGVIGYFVTSLFQTSLKNSTQSNALVQVDTFKRNLINDLSNDSAWANTVAKNPSLACLAPLFATPPGQATCPNPTTVSNFVVQNGGPGGGSTVYDPSQPQNGFSSQGAPCSGFSASGNDSCPFRYDIKVKISCSSGTSCGTPEVETAGAFRYSPATTAAKVTLNTLRYSFNFIRGVNGNSVVGSGTGGFLPVWDGAAGTPTTQLGNSVAFQDSAGRIGLGTQSPGVPFEVAGAIKPGAGTSGGACPSEGALAYDMSAHAPVYCSNAGSWKIVGGVTPGAPGSPCMNGSGINLVFNMAQFCCYIYVPSYGIYGYRCDLGSYP